MASFLNVCRFNPTAGGTTDWTFSAAVTGYQSPASAGVTNGATYHYRAESSDLSQWEIGTGTYNTGTGVLARTTVLYNSSATGTATGQSGAGTKISFSATPQVAIVALGDDIAVGQFPGTATNDSASAGNVGEYISSSVASGSAVGLTTGTAANVTSISLTAGDWDVWGMIQSTGNASTVISLMIAWISTTSATTPTSPNNGGYSITQNGISITNPANAPSLSAGQMRISVAGTTTVYLGALINFTTSTCSAFGFIGARRVR